MIDVYKLMLYSNCSPSSNEITIYRYKKDEPWRASFNVNPDNPIVLGVPRCCTIDPEIEMMSLTKFFEREQANK